MTHLNDKDRAAQMADMKSFNEPMPSVGSFSFDSEKKVLCNVCKKEITPKMIEDAGAKGVQVIECPTRFESHSLPSGRIIWNTDKFEILGTHSGRVVRTAGAGIFAPVLRVFVRLAL